MTIEEMQLEEPALGAAREVEHAFPGIVFTSGRRTIDEQAEAMACNVKLNRNWIAQTYAQSRVAIACQQWITLHPQPMNHANIVAALLRVMRNFPDWELAKLSKHLAGRAFDVHPVGDPQGAAMRVLLHAKAAERGGKFLEREGGLPRWHWEG